jgi:hypothetical protein
MTTVLGPEVVEEDVVARLTNTERDFLLCSVRVNAFSNSILQELLSIRKNIADNLPPSLTVYNLILDLTTGKNKTYDYLYKTLSPTDITLNPSDTHTLKTVISWLEHCYDKKAVRAQFSELFSEDSKYFIKNKQGLAVADKSSNAFSKFVYKRSNIQSTIVCLVLDDFDVKIPRTNLQVLRVRRCDVLHIKQKQAMIDKYFPELSSVEGCLYVELL